MVIKCSILKSKQWQIFSVLILLLIFSACSSNKKSISSGNYDVAIDDLVEKLQKHSNSKNISMLNQAFHLANNEDIQAIQSLRSSGQPDIWEGVFDLYSELQLRQQTVGVLSPDILREINFTQVDYDMDREASAQKAALFYYTLATRSLSDGSYENHADAYNYLKKVQRIYPGFKDVEELLKGFRSVDPLFIYYHIENSYPYELPPGVESSLETIDLSKFDMPAYRFVDQKPPTDQYKVFVHITITGVKISPEQTGELAFTESAKILDGYVYKLDDDGEFVRDSLGQKIEIPKFETLVCFVNQYKQEKSMKLTGKVEIINRNTGQTLGMKSVEGESNFVNVYAKFNGDMDALSAESFELVGTQKQEFPVDAAMIIHAADNLGRDAVLKIAQVLDNVAL